MTVRTLGLSMLTVIALCALALTQASAWRLPGDHTGYAPVQPIAFSHRLHAGDMQISCLYCHAAAPKSRHAGIPPVQTCLNCHTFISSVSDAIALPGPDTAAPAVPPSEELKKVRRFLESGLDERAKSDTLASIEWVRVHDLPDHVRFDHSRHVNAGVDCVSCHGDVASMERVRQEQSFTMGLCLDCHRQTIRTRTDTAAVKAAVLEDCGSCHQ